MSVSIELDNTFPTSEWLKGLIDLHIYNRPCIFERMFTTTELAKQCRNVGYRAIVIKNHFYPTMESAYMARQEVPGIGVYGSITLNWPVGGLNPFAAYSAIELGAKIVWMGSMHAGTLSDEPFRSKMNFSDLVNRNNSWMKAPDKRWMIRPPTNVIDLKTGEILPEVMDIIDLIAEYDVLLATDSLSKRECFAIVPAAVKAGVKKILVNAYRIHPVEDPEKYYTIEELQKITSMGAMLENYAAPYRDYYSPRWDKLVEMIKGVGADKYIIDSDSGHAISAHPIEAMRQFIFNLRKRGIKEHEIELMTKKNPAKLLGLE